METIRATAASWMLLMKLDLEIYPDVMKGMMTFNGIHLLRLRRASLEKRRPEKCRLLTRSAQNGWNLCKEVSLSTSTDETEAGEERASSGVVVYVPRFLRTSACPGDRGFYEEHLLTNELRFRSVAQSIVHQSGSPSPDQASDLRSFRNFVT